MEARNVVKFQNLRQRKENFNRTFQRKLQVSKDFIKRLGLESELSGHSGCVNCLQWNEAGDLLASGSDDLNIMLWTPFLSKRLHAIQSGHYGNIFSVKFLPGSNDNCIVSCAADFKILVNDYTSEEIIYSCRCHNGRVKRIATAPSFPNMFWSAAEDGQIVQSDLRCPHECSTTEKNVLVNLTNHLGHSAEAKCIAINPVKPDLIAIGANDPFVRMYDRRMIKLTTPKFCTVPSQTTTEENGGDDNLYPGCVSYFIAGHLPLKQRDFKRRFRSLTSTYVTFSPDGKDLLTNLGGEQIYLFNIASKRKKPIFNMTEKALNLNATKKTGEDLKKECSGQQSPSDSNSITTNEGKHSSHCLHNSTISSTPPLQQKLAEKCNLTPEVEEIKKVANQAFERKNFTVAITLYSSAIASCPKAACLYSNRAAAYMKRAWDGDYYAAVRDCLAALELDPFHLKAHFRLVQCLHSLHWAKEAYDSIQAFKIKFPNHIKSKSFEVIENDVKTSVFSQKSRSSQSSSTMQRSDDELPEAEDTMSEFETNDSDEDEASSSSSGRDALFQCFHSFNFGCLEISNQEKAWRASAYDYEYRYCGHCNTTTDIKEANFFGSYGEYIIAGSDDGLMFFWERATTNIVRVLRGDDSIVNCLQPHPSNCMLATSGIDPVVRLWSPRPEDGSREEREILDQDDAAFANQRRMNTDPLEVMLRNMGYRVPNVNIEEMDEDNNRRPGGSDPTVLCRTS